MAIIDIPTGNLPYEVVAKLPTEGEPNKIYGVPVEDEEGLYTDYRYHNGEWQIVDLGAQIFGFLFNDYQESVQETVTEMEQTITAMEETIAAQETKITELEEAVFPTTLVSFEMSITSLIMTELDLVDEDDNVVEANAFATDIWESEPMTFQSELKAGTYYLRNQDGYALGKPNGEIQPLIVDGTEIVQLGSVEIVMIQPPKGSEVK